MSRRVYLILAIVFVVMTAAPAHAALVVFSQNFGDLGPNIACPNPSPFPAGWTRYNVDGLTPNSAVAFVNDAWIVREDFGGSVVRCVAFSTSWYSPVGQSDDWMVTPVINVPTLHPRLTFLARAYDPAFPDGYEVRWASTNSVAAFMANTPLLTVPAEGGGWTPRTIDLAAAGLAGQPVYFAFRNHSTDKYLLVMDDVQVESVPDHDIAITSALRPHANLTLLPIAQGYPLQLGATIQNIGLQSVTNIVVTAHVKVDGVEVQAIAAAPVASLAASVSATVTMAPYVVAQLGAVTVDYTVTLNETDQDPSNNSMTPTASVTVTKSELGGDDGVAVGQLGVGDSAGGQLGNMFHLVRPMRVKAIRYYTTGTNPDLAGDSIIGEIRSMTTIPASLLAQTQPYLVPTPPVAGFFDLPLATPLTLAAGDYYFGLIEPAHDVGQTDTLDIGLSTTFYTPGRGWANFVGHPWENLETFGSQYRKAAMVRAIFLNDANLSVTKSASPSPVPAGGAVTYTIGVSNAGPDVATDIVVTDPLPAGTSFVSASGAGWTCSQLAGTVTCSRASLSVGSAPAISIVVTAPIANVTLSNTATVTASSNDPDGASATAMTPVVPVDLAVTKSGPAAIVAGNNITYTLGATNNGAIGAQNVTLTDALPPGTTFVSVTQNSGPTFTCINPPFGGTGSVSCSIATLASAASATFAVVLRVGPNLANGATLTNTASITPVAGDPTPGNNTQSTSATVGTSANLAVTKSGPAAIAAGNNITYSISLTNNGPSDAASITLTDTLPAGTTFVSEAQNTGPSFTCIKPSVGGTGSVSCSIATLISSASATFTLVFKVDPAVASGTTITNSASVATVTPDPTPGNNSASVVTTVSSGNVDLSITKTPSAPPYGAGLAVTYTLTVNNAGPSPATGVTVTDVIPAGTAFVSATPSQGSCSGTSTVTCTLGTIISGGTATISLALTLPSTPGAVANTASVTTSSPDTNTANNSSTATVTVISAAQIPALAPLGLLLLLATIALLGAVRLRG